MAHDVTACHVGTPPAVGTSRPVKRPDGDGNSRDIRQSLFLTAKYDEDSILTISRVRTFSANIQIDATYNAFNTRSLRNCRDWQFQAT